MKKITQKKRAELAAEFETKLAQMLAALAESARSKFAYNLETNVPAGIVAPADAVENSLRSGLVNSAAQLHEFGCELTVSIATDILEDSNCHSEAAALCAAARNNGLNV